ncbi:MAG: biopolymer transporter ExbD [Verrucomicrobiales bacterium]|nr:biopolymer transporter ExbD [Verrucomicrobiales bacterium]MED5585563.1 biopolymer transporter ExbD [Verrucomicrobiota bacterium]
MKRKAIGKDEVVSFQITPMIDMTFLLLIFFMVTSKLSKEQVKMDVNLPTASASRIPDDLSNRDVINVDKDGNFYIANTMASPEQLKQHLEERFKAAPPLKIYYRADKGTPYEVTEKFMKLAAEAGAHQVLFGTYRK